MMKSYNVTFKVGETTITEKVHNLTCAEQALAWAHGKRDTLASDTGEAVKIARIVEVKN